jgi:hypothetical protein
MATVDGRSFMAAQATRERWIGAACAAIAIGCGAPAEPPVDGGASDAGGDATPAPDADTTPSFSCPPIDAIDIGESAAGRTFGASTTEPASNYVQCFGGEGPEAVVAFRTERVHVGVELVLDAEFDAVLSLRSACEDAASMTECADATIGVGGETLRFEPESGVTYFVVIDGFRRGSAGAYTLTATLDWQEVREGEACDLEGHSRRCPSGTWCDFDSLVCSRENRCGNLSDEDLDGDPDCVDEDCRARPLCEPGAGAFLSPCTAATDCASHQDAPLCLSEDRWGFPGGLCSEYCDPFPGGSLMPCPAGSVCAPLPFIDAGLAGVCLPVCETAADCPGAGYRCATDFVGNQVCIPECDADSDCTSGHQCNDELARCGPVESCAGGDDDDWDDRRDCEDLDCASDASCTAQIDALCSGARNAAIGVNRGDTREGAATIAGSCTGAGGAREHVWRFRPEAAGPGFLSIALTPDNQQGLYLRRDCDDARSELLCLPPVTGGTQRAHLPLDGGTDAFFVVDSANDPVRAGPYELTLAWLPNRESEPNDATSPDEYIAPFGGAIDPFDEDFIGIDVPGPASALELRVTDIDPANCRHARRSSGLPDPELEVFAPDGRSLAFADDEAAHLYCPSVRLAGLAGGRYVVRVASSAAHSPGGAFIYRLEATVTP